MTTVIIEQTNVAELVFTSLREVLEQSDLPVPSVMNEQTALIGQGAVLDSLALVSLVVDLEQRLEEDYGMAVVLASDRAMSQARSPFLTTGTLTAYICELMAEGCAA